MLTGSQPNLTGKLQANERHYFKKKGRKGGGRERRKEGRRELYIGEERELIPKASN